MEDKLENNDITKKKHLVEEGTLENETKNSSTTIVTYLKICRSHSRMKQDTVEVFFRYVC